MVHRATGAVNPTLEGGTVNPTLEEPLGWGGTEHAIPRA